MATLEYDLQPPLCRSSFNGRSYPNASPGPERALTRLDPSSAKPLALQLQTCFRDGAHVHG